jgi:hypothetical protein
MSNYDELEKKAARFLNEHTDPAIGADFEKDGYSLEEMMDVIERRSDDGDPDCLKFLEEEVPWEDIEIPDPRGWANQP